MVLNDLVLDIVAECIKNLVENVRCPMCDKLEGDRLRYPCGHSACTKCLPENPECLLCTPPLATEKSEPIVDSIYSKLTKNSVKLMKSFNETFHIDVYKRRRISDQLKVERELFPECIQAPTTYSNKHRISDISIMSDKMRRLSKLFADESMSYASHKDSLETNKNVQEWFEKNEREKLKREPFTAIDVNVPLETKKSHALRLRRKNKIEKHNKKIISKNKKSSSITSPSLLQDQGHLNKYFRSSKKDKESSELSCQDESGIVLDDEPIIIEDSQSQEVDKDELAWLAVLEQQKKENFLQKSQSETSSFIDEGHVSTFLKKDFVKVKFLKKSFLFQSCSDCKTDFILNTNVKKCTDICVRMENNELVATITVKQSNVGKIKVITKQSEAIQTDVTSFKHLKSQRLSFGSRKNISREDQNTINNCNDNRDCLMETAITSKTLNKVENIVIEDSDKSDNIDLEEEIAGTLQMNNDVLSELPVIEKRNYKRQVKRRRTPASSDSSEKENRDPNRIKKLKPSKKFKKKPSVMKS